MGSLIALAVWFHFDLQGFWEQKQHDRIVRKGAQHEQRAKDARIKALTHEFKHHDQ